jgi:hypothetical protein
MNNQITVIVLLGAIASVLSILVGTVTIGRTLVSITNSFNASSQQLNSSIYGLSGQVQLHVTEAAGKFELLEYRIHAVDQKIDHKAQRFEKELDKVRQLEGWAEKNYNYKVRGREDGQL